MTYNTAFNHGDKVWVANYHGITRLTVGKISIEHTKSVGDPNNMFDNYKPQEEYRESYMMEETGIGTGQVYTLGVHVFKTEVEAHLKYKEYKEYNK